MIIILPEFGLERVPEESSIAPLLLRDTPMHPPILEFCFYPAFQELTSLYLPQFHMLILPFSHRFAIVWGSVGIVVRGWA